MEEQNLTTQQEIEVLKERIKALEEYVQQRKLQQISFPLDEVSKTIINEI
jgi:hypothetical protein